MSLVKKFFHYILPSIVAMWVYSIYTMVDGIFVARGVGPEALGAVNIAMPYVNGVFAASILFGTGASTTVAILLGKKREQEASHVFSMNTAVLTAVSLVLTAVTLIFLDPIARFLGATQGNILYVKQYLSVISSFNVFFILSYSFEVMVKTDGFPKLSPIGVCTSAVTNIVLDWLFVMMFHWGVVGAAVATGISQVFSTAVFAVHFLRRRGTLRFCRFPLRLSLYKKIVSLGFSDCITESSVGVITFLFNHMILREIGEQAIVSYTVIAYFNTLVLMTMAGISQGIQPLVSFYHGRGEEKTCRAFLRMAVYAVAAASLLSFLLSQTMGQYAVAAFIDRAAEAELFEYTVGAFRLFSFAFLAAGFNVVFAGFFAAAERPAFALVVSLGRGMVLIALSLVVMTALFGETGIWLSSAASEGVCLLLSLGLFLVYLRKSPAGQRGAAPAMVQPAAETE
ncbi:MAG: MATE family efflux transporter [Oscillospiraceae bacterium]|nr:MATE family efflux transporter [Oscillospiraceae bacterium]